MATGDFWESRAVRTASVVTPVFGVLLAHSTPSVATRTASRPDAVASGGNFVLSGRSVATRTATAPIPAGLGGLEETAVVLPAVATRSASSVTPIVTNARDSTPSVATRTATDVTATVGGKEVASFPSIAIREATAVRAAVGKPPDQMRRDRPRRFLDIDRVFVTPKGEYLIRAGAALSRQGIAAVPLVVGLPFAGFAIERAEEYSPTVDVQPCGVCDLEVEGATSAAANGREVRALHADRFTLAAAGELVGRVVVWLGGRRCRVYFEAEPFRGG